MVRAVLFRGSSRLTTVVAVVVAVVLFACGCRAAPPSEAEARAALAARQPALERIEDAVFTLVGMSATGGEVFDAALTDVAALGGAIGLRITGLGHTPPCVGGEAPENVPQDRGFTEGRYRVGWGLYQTAWENGGVKHGDDAYHPGIVVTWKLGMAEHEATACFLLDGAARPL